MLPVDGRKYSLFQILTLFSQQTNLEYIQYFKVNVKEKQQYFKIEILKNANSGDKVMIKINDVTQMILLQ